MTTPVTYPPGTISLYGTKQALKNQDTWISYIGVDGSIFYLAGPQAPVAGAQDGLVLIKHMGLMSPFEMLELRGARQDGATWTDAVYDVGDIMFGLEASGLSPQEIRDVIRHWISAWDPRRPGTLSVFTPDMGEWWAKVRLGKNIPDMFTKDYTWSGRQQFTWNIRNYDAFWYSVDSVSAPFMLPVGNNLSEDFTGEANAFTLNATNWNQFFDASHVGTFGIQNGAATYIGSTPETVDVLNVYKTASVTDDQVVSVTLAGHTHADFFFGGAGVPIPAGSYIDLWARVNSAGTSGIRMRISANSGFFGFFASTTVQLSYFNAGVRHDWGSQTIWNLPNPGDSFSLLAGTDSGVRNIRAQKNGVTIFSVTDTAAASNMGSSYRGMGFGVGVANSSSTLVIPPPIASWSGGDNLKATQSGYVSLTNIGDVEAWPRYLVYGPGTFSFGNGPGSSNMITLGPLLDNQVVLVTTEPRLRSVVDISPAAPTTSNQTQPQLNIIQQLLNALTSFATNNNTPPLLNQFTNVFGVNPPQGNLYPLLSGRFTNPIPGSPYGVAPATQKIAVSITNGSAVSRVIAAITPRRRWPL